MTNFMMLLTMIFQSTLPRGSDLHHHYWRRCQHGISIHAPSRERRACRQISAASRYFNPRSLAGATVPPRAALSYQRYFNPRSLAGATPIVATSLASCKPISIHAPSRERHIKTKKTLNFTLFQSTLPRGSDRLSSVHMRR